MILAMAAAAFLALGYAGPPGGPALKGQIVADGAGCLRTGASDPENAGRVATGATVKRRMTFVNDSPEEARVSILSRTCGCLNANFSSEVVAPGGQTELALSVHVAPAAGEQVQVVRFEVLCGEGEAKRRSVANARMRYQPTVAVETFPSEFDVRRIVGQSVTLDVYMRAISAQDQSELRIDGGQCESPDIRFVGSYDVVGTSDVRVAKFICDSVPMAGIDSTLVVLSSASPSGEIRIPVRIHPLSKMRCSPGGLMLARASSIGTLTLTPRLQADTSPWPTAFRVEGSPGVRVTFGAPLNAALPVSIELLPDAPACGQATVHLLGADGSVCASVPIAWLD